MKIQILLLATATLIASQVAHADRRYGFDDHRYYDNRYYDNRYYDHRYYNQQHHSEHRHHPKCGHSYGHAERYSAPLYRNSLSVHTHGLVESALLWQLYNLNDDRSDNRHRAKNYDRYDKRHDDRNQKHYSYERNERHDRDRDRRH